MRAVVDRDAVLRDFLDLVRIDSESGHERAVADWLAPRLTELGGSVQFDNAAAATGGDCGNLIAQFPGDARPALLFAAHMDTVKPGRGINPVVEGNRVRSDGTTILGADDKAGIAAILAALRHAPADRRPPLDVVFTVSEETGLMGAKELAPSLLRARAGYILDAEGPVGAVTVAAPAHEHYHVITRGKAAHAGIAPGDGRNAIRALAQAVARFPQGALAEDTTANIGSIGGGTARNIVAAEAWVDGEVRSHRPDELRRQVESIRAITAEVAAQTGVTMTVRTERQYAAFAVPAAHPLLAAVLDALPPERPLRMQSSNGGSDANILNALGITTVVLAAAFANVHTTEEYVDLDELTASAQLLTDIMEHWSR